MASPDPEVYTNGHRAFLQAFMSRSTMTFSEARPILANIFSISERPTLPNDVTLQDFSDAINIINSTIHAFDMEIRSTYPQTATTRSHESRIYALVNLASDPQTQLATSHTPDEIAFVKRVLDAIFETNNSQSKEIMAVRAIDALNVARVTRTRDLDATQGTASTGIKKDQAEKVLASLVEEGWFEKSRGGYYSLSPRCLIELRDWLVDTYNEDPDLEMDEVEGAVWQRIKFCEGCKDVVTMGQRCANRDCFCRFHEFCVNSTFRNQTEKKCPTCKTEWDGEHYVGEKVVAKRNTSNGRPSAASRRESTVMDEDDDASE